MRTKMRTTCYQEMFFRCACKGSWAGQLGWAAGLGSWAGQLGSSLAGQLGWAAELSSRAGLGQVSSFEVSSFQVSRLAPAPVRAYQASLRGETCLISAAV